MTTARMTQILSVVQMPASGSILGLGTSEVTLVATDEWGNSAILLACGSLLWMMKHHALSCPASVAPLVADANPAKELGSGLWWLFPFLYRIIAVLAVAYSVGAKSCCG